MPKFSQSPHEGLMHIWNLQLYATDLCDFTHYLGAYNKCRNLSLLEIINLIENLLVGRQLPHLRDVFRMYSGMTYGTTVRDLCLRFNPASLHIDERRLVQFGVLEGLIRRVERVSRIDKIALKILM